jgi:hypothetical protein
MVSRVVAALLVLVLVGPSVVTATCELACVMASHHHGTPSSTEASCHEHQGGNQAAGVQPNSVAPCHESGGLPSAVVDAWLNTILVPIAPAVAIVIALPSTARTTARAHARSAPFDPRPAHRPLRV